MQQKSNAKFNFKKSLIFYLTNNWWKFLIFAFVLALDLVTKSILVNQNQELWQNYVLIDGVLVIMPTRNFGAGFSLLSGLTWLLITLTIVFIVLFMAYNLFFQKKSKLYAVASALILTGAVGNLIDRFAFGYVRDFIYLQFINFPVFNVADMSLTFGVILLIIYILFYSSKPKRKNLINASNESELQNVDNKKILNEQQSEFIDNDKRQENNKNDGVNNAKDSDR